MLIVLTHDTLLEVTHPSLRDDLAAKDDLLHVTQVVQVRQRIPSDDDQVCDLAFLDGPEVVVAAEDPRRVDCRGLQRIVRRQAAFLHEQELVHDASESIATGSNKNPAFMGLSDAFPLGVHHEFPHRRC